ncbi:MAG: FtsQ-type POTRA domain-containing protein [Candidatus Berkelbacteria bacterium]|nr:FtsQ-type POTRA domain-containing protein [Candidatus Berkelbacteria bacterium]
MRSSEKYSYSKYRNKESVPTGSGKVFVGSKIEYTHNPIVNLPAKFWGNIFLILLILVALWLIYYSSFFKIKEIIIEGNTLVPSQQILNNVTTGQNIFRFSISSAQERIMESSPMIADVAIYRGIPNALKIVVLERKPQMVWLSAGNYYLVDDAGVVDKQISSDEFVNLIHVSDQKNMPVKIGEQLISAGFISFAENISNKFFIITNIHPTGYYITETTFDIYVQTDAGFYVKFDTIRNVDKQLENLKNIIIAYRPNIHEYIDVRINGWAYYK